MIKLWEKMRRLVCVGIALTGMSASATAAVVLDWSEWEGSFVDGRRGWQSFTNSDGVQVRYRNNRIRNDRGTPRADLIFGTPSILNAGQGGVPFQPFNGTGGAPDDYLDIFQDVGVGNGTRHRFQFNSGLDGASIEIWDIDSSISNGRNYTDQVRLVAIDSTGQEIQPTRAIITNGNIVVQVAGDTWQARPDAQVGSISTDGNLTVFFDAPDIREIRVEYLNAGGGDVSSPDSDTQAIGIYNISETGLLSLPIPEPGSAMLVMVGMAVFGARRRR